MVVIVKDMVSTSQPMMAELRKLHCMLTGLGLKAYALWITSAVNRFTEAHSCTWDPNDVSLSRHLLRLIRRHYKLECCAFAARPFNETKAALCK